MAQLLGTVDPSSIAFQPPSKHGPIYVMRPCDVLLLQTPAVTCCEALADADRKLQVELDPVTDAWIRAFEASFKAFAKANTAALFNKELDPAFIDESFRSCLPCSPGPLSMALAQDAAIFEHTTHELVGRGSIQSGTRVNLMFEIACIQFGKRWFTPKLRVRSLRIAPAAPPPPPSPAEPPTPTYETVGWVEDDEHEPQQQQQAGCEGTQQAADSDAWSIDLDQLDEPAAC